MKILIAAVSFSSNISGVERHALNLMRCLLLQPEISALHLVVGPWQRQMLQSVQSHLDPRLTTHVADVNRSSRSRNLWYYRRLPVLAAQLQIDLVHLSFPMPCNGSAFHCPTILTLHDMYPYEIPLNFGFPKFVLNRLALRQCLRNVGAITCVSEATRARLKQYAGARVWQKSTQIYNYPMTAPVSSSQSPIPAWKGEPFLLCIAQHRRNKNIPTLIRAFDRLLRFGQISSHAQLVVIGIRGPESEAIDRLTSRSNLTGNIHLLEGLSEPELQWCYLHCEALVAPSLTEGFGAPVAEGLLAGCRIVCSDIPAHREIGEGYCRFVALGKDSAEAFAGAIASALRAPKQQPVFLPMFSAPAIGKQYVALYRRILTSASFAPNAASASPIRISTSEGQPL
jgi:glycosyltransferase involved in cell wall biosynthesis